MPKTLTDIRSLARSYGPEMVRVLASIARQKAAPPSARVAAASSLLDRGYGKAEQAVESKSDLQITIRQILDAPAPKLVAGRVVDHIQHKVDGMPASDNQKAEGRAVEKQGRAVEREGRAVEQGAPSPKSKG